MPDSSPRRGTLDVGSLVGGTYRIESLLGQGGMGAVFRATHERLPGKLVAIKIIHAELVDDEILARFKHEAYIASRLNHPNIVGVTDFNVQDGTPYLVLEYLEGENLAHRLRQGPIALPQALAIARQIGAALAAAHRDGVIHRDLKPGNIFLVPSESHGKVTEVAKLLDFGISKMRGSQTVKTLESSLLGTPQYMSPEQARGDHASVDERADIFALGTIVYEMLTATPAFSGNNIPEVVFKVVYEQPTRLAQIVPDLPEHVIAAIEQAMAKSADARFTTVNGFIQALTGEPLAMTRPGGSIPPIDADGPSSGRAPKSGGAGPVKSLAPEAFHATVGPPSSQKNVFSTEGSTHVGVPQSLPPKLLDPVVTVDVPARADTTPAPQISREAKTVPSVKPKTPTPLPMPAIRATLPAETIAAPPPKRSKVIWVIVPVVAIAAAGGMYLAMRGSSPSTNPSPPIDAPVVAARDVDAAVALPPDAQVVAADAAVAADAHVAVADAAVHAPADAHVAVKADAGASEPPDPTGGGSPAIKQQLLDAEAALRRGDSKTAVQMANEIMFSNDAGAGQRNEAHGIHGEAMCRFNNSLEDARIDLRAIKPTTARAYARVIRVCKSVGIDVE